MKDVTTVTGCYEIAAQLKEKAKAAALVCFVELDLYCAQFNIRIYQSGGGFRRLKEYSAPLNNEGGILEGVEKAEYFIEHIDEYRTAEQKVDELRESLKQAEQELAQL